MAIYEVQAPDGSIIIVEGPDDATEKELIAAASKGWKQEKPKLSDEQIATHSKNAAKSMPQNEYSMLADIAASGLGRFVTGLGKPAMAVGEMIPGGVGAFFKDQTSRLKDLEARGARTQSLPEKLSAELGGVGGAIFGAYPLTMAPMMSGASGILPKIGQYVGNTGIGAGIGALSGLLTPVGNREDFGGVKKEQALQGGLLGGALSSAFPLVSSGYNFMRSRGGELLDLVRGDKGAANIANRYLSRITDGNTKKLAYALNRADEIVPGSKPTAAEVVSSMPEGSVIQEHQRIVSQEPAGGISSMFGKRIADQRAAREAQLAFAGTEDDVSRLVTERAAAVKPLYEAVEKSTANVRASPVLMKVNDIISKNKNTTAIASPLSQIRDKLIIRTENGAKIESNPQALKSLSDEIGDMMGKKTVGGTQEYDVKVLREVKALLDEQIGKAVPEYRSALATFADKSKPIDVMNIGQALKGKLTNPTGAETPGTYLRALENEKKLLKDSIGFGRTSVDKILSAPQAAAVEKVAKDLERTVASTHPLQKTNLRGGVNVADETTISLPNLLYRPAMFANYLLKAGGKDIEPAIDAYIARLYLNPKEFGKVLAQIDPAKRAEVSRIIHERVRVLSAMGAGASERKDEE